MVLCVQDSLISKGKRPLKLFDPGEQLQLINQLVIDISPKKFKLGDYFTQSRY